MTREREESGSGKWIAAIGGAATGAGVAFSTGTALKVKHGFRDAVVGAAHAVSSYGKSSIEFIEKFNAGLASPDAFKQFVTDNRVLADQAFARVEKLIDSKKYKKNITQALKNERTAAQFKKMYGDGVTAEEIIKQTQDVFAQIKAEFGKINETTAEGWERAHSVAKRIVTGLLGKAGISFDFNQALPQEIQEAFAHVKESLPSAEQLNEAGYKKSLISRIPGGVNSITAAGSILGATMAYMAVAGIEKSLHSQGKDAAPEATGKKWSEKMAVSTQEAAFRAV